jgi:flagellar P-ring protein precursor FlgI
MKGDKMAAYKKALVLMPVMALIITLIPAVVFATPAKIKDLTSMTGMRSNDLIGYGIVVGLSGTGDKGKDLVTVESVVNMLDKLGVRVPLDQIETMNCAAVIVTAVLPPTCEQGEKIDIHISSIGNAKSLYGGTLLMTPLKAGNNELCAVAQGSVAVGGHNFEVNNNSVSKNAPTSGFIAGGASVQKKIDADFTADSEVALFTSRNDFELAEAIIKGINAKFGSGMANTTDGKKILVRVPAEYMDKKVQFIAEMSSMEIDDPGEPSVVLDERTGTVIMGAQVPVDEVAISHGNLHVAISSKNIISQPNPFSPGTTIQAVNSNMTVDQDRANFATLKKGATLADVVKNLNTMGVSADDIISIITDMKVAGAIKGKVIVK